MKDAGLSCGHVCDEPSREQARGPAGRRVKTPDSCFNAPCSIHTDREIQDWPTACTGESVQLAPFVGKTPFSPSTLLPCPALFCVFFVILKRVLPSIVVREQLQLNAELSYDLRSPGVCCSVLETNFLWPLQTRACRTSGTSLSWSA